MNDKLREQLHGEITAINSVFTHRNARVKTAPGLTHVAGDAYIVYELDYDPTFDVDRIPDFVPNLQEALSRKRQRACPVRVRFMPLALVVDHPFPAPLAWSRIRGLAALSAGQMLAGRSYLDHERPNEIVDLQTSPHVLIAGTTGSGKSTLQLLLALSLMISTSPRDLEIHVIDLKNEDLVGLAELPHVRSMAVTVEEAVNTIAYVNEIKDARITSGRGPYKRVVLVIDELAQLAGSKEALNLLGSLASIGRSKAINLIVATQKPTAEVLSSMGRANFPVRLVGRVSDATEAHIATGRRQSGAERLPGAGAFLRVESGEPVRFQAFKLDAAGIDWLRDSVVGAWGLGTASAPAPSTQAQTRSSQTPAQAQQTTPALAAVFAAYLQPDGTLRYGGMRQAAIALYGSDAPTSGRAYDQVKTEIERQICIWKASQQAPIVRLPVGKSGGKTSAEGFVEDSDQSLRTQLHSAD